MGAPHLRFLFWRLWSIWACSSTTKPLSFQLASRSVWCVQAANRASGIQSDQCPPSAGASL